MDSIHPRQTLTDMLARSLGNETAARTVDTAAQAVGAGERLSRDDALRVLEQIAREQGIVGIAARFAKSRVHLVWGATEVKR